MTSARPGSTRRGGRDRFQYLVGAFVVLAVASTLVSVLFSDDRRWLLLGVVLALWGLVLASIAMTRSRREAASAQARAADLKTVYDLELEREITARRMHEHQVERTVREELRAEASTDMAELREELRALRENLAALLGGELLVERVALRAESTRLRSLSDTARMAAGVGAIEHRRDVEDAVEAAPPHPDDVRTAGSTEVTDVLPRVDETGRPAEPLVASRDPEPEPEPEVEPKPAVAAEPVVAPEPEPVAVEPTPPPAVEPEPTPEPARVESAAERLVAEPEPEPEAVAERPVAAGGRRRRPEPDEAAVAVAEPEPDQVTEPEVVADPEPEEDDDEGAHSAGRSVSELMAAYGVSAGSSPRRRRRAD